MVEPTSLRELGDLGVGFYLKCGIEQQLDLRSISDTLDRQLPGTFSVPGWALGPEYQNE